MFDDSEDLVDEMSKDAKINLWSSTRGGKLKLSLNELEKQLKESTTPDELFIHRFFLFIVGCIQMPTTSVHIGISILGSIIGLSSVCRKNWATMSFTHLLDMINHFKVKCETFLSDYCVVRC